MKDKIQIVNFLLTRRCNLRCDYCGIARDNETYGSIKRFINNEISTERVLHFLDNLKVHNPDAFVIWYGGEPLLRNDIRIIIQHCHDIGINYSIITNNTGIVKNKLDDLINKVGYLQGLTSSIDPVFSYDDMDSESYLNDIGKKSIEGINGLLKYKDKVKDLVAEITVDNNSIDNLYPLVSYLSKLGINSSITFIDVAKNKYYDFSNISDESILVNKNEKIKSIINKIISDKLDVHMRDTILEKIVDILPSNLDCKIENNFHNLTVDADGSIRLCLRICGKNMPSSFNVDNIFNDDGTLNEYIKDIAKSDKDNYCLKCNWTCMLFSQLTSENPDELHSLIHTEKRKN